MLINFLLSRIYYLEKFLHLHSSLLVVTNSLQFQAWVYLTLELCMRIRKELLLLWRSCSGRTNVGGNTAINTPRSCGLIHADVQTLGHAAPADTALEAKM